MFWPLRLWLPRLYYGNPRGEILLGLRSNQPAKGYWFVPGKRILRNETLDGVFSLLRTRPSIYAGNSRLLGACDHRYEDDVIDAGIGTHYVVFAYHPTLFLMPSQRRFKSLA